VVVVLGAGVGLSLSAPCTKSYTLEMRNAGAAGFSVEPFTTDSSSKIRDGEVSGLSVVVSISCSSSTPDNSWIEGGAEDVEIEVGGMGVVEVVVVVVVVGVVVVVVVAVEVEVVEGVVTVVVVVGVVPFRIF